MVWPKLLSGLTGSPRSSGTAIQQPMLSVTSGGLFSLLSRFSEEIFSCQFCCSSEGLVLINSSFSLLRLAIFSGLGFCSLFSLAFDNFRCRFASFLLQYGLSSFLKPLGMDFLAATRIILVICFMFWLMSCDRAKLLRFVWMELKCVPVSFLEFQLAFFLKYSLLVLASTMWMVTGTWSLPSCPWFLWWPVSVYPLWPWQGQGWMSSYRL